MKTLEQQIASLQLHPHQHHPQSRTISPQRQQPQQQQQQQPHSPLYDNTSDHHKTFSNSPQQRSYNNNYHNNIYNNDIMLQQENNNNNNNNRNLLGSGDSSAMMTHSPIHWIGFNDLNNMSCPFSSSKSGRMMASSLSSASSSSSTLPANESWMTEDADQVQIICRLRDCTEDDIGVDVFDDHGACLKVYKRSSAPSVPSQPRNLAQPFDKVFALPRDTNPDAMKRSVDQNGQLIISIPKM